MRFVFKTDYDQDIRLLKHSGYWWSYGVLLAALIAFPYLVGSYLQSQIVFVFIYAIVGVALIILTGFTGQASLGHAAFPAIGAYTAGFLQSQGISFIVYFPAAAIITGAVGAMVGFPALRLSGIYLVIATIAFAFIVEEILARWESVTHGNEGMRVRTLDLLGPADTARRRRLLLPLPAGAGGIDPAGAEPCCARPPAAPSSPSATPRPRPRAWASTSPATR